LLSDGGPNDDDRGEIGDWTPDIGHTIDDAIKGQCLQCRNDNQEYTRIGEACGASLSTPDGLGAEIVQQPSTRYHGLDALLSDFNPAATQVA
jgi:hypothetical protein